MFATASAARTPFLSFEPRRELEPENRSHLKFRKFLSTAATLRFVCLDTPLPLATCACARVRCRYEAEGVSFTLNFAVYLARTTIYFPST